LLLCEEAEKVETWGGVTKYLIRTSGISLGLSGAVLV
jgi:hypothetical protein